MPANSCGVGRRWSAATTPRFSMEEKTCLSSLAWAARNSVAQTAQELLLLLLLLLLVDYGAQIPDVAQPVFDAAAAAAPECNILWHTEGWFSVTIIIIIIITIFKPPSGIDTEGKKTIIIELIYRHTVVTSEPLAAGRISVQRKREWIKKF